MSSYFHCCFFICDFACCYAQYAEKLMHILHKKSAYPYSNLKFFLRPFYVLSTSFLRNRYYEAGRLNILYIAYRVDYLGGIVYLGCLCQKNVVTLRTFN